MRQFLISRLLISVVVVLMASACNGVEASSQVTPPPPKKAEAGGDPTPASAARSVSGKARGAPAGYFPYVDDGYALTQVNTNVFYPWFGELPLADWSKYEWKDLNLNMVAAGDVDPISGWVKALPKGPMPIIDIRPFRKEYPEIGAGDWIIEWDGDGRVDVPGFSTRRIGDGAIAVSIGPSDRARAVVTVTKAPVRIKFIGLASDRGKLWSAKFVDDVSRYKIIRTMNWNGVNGAKITHAQQVARMSDGIWGVSPASPGREWPADQIHFGVPYQAIFQLCVEAGSACWVNVPTSLGAQSVINELMVAGHGDRTVRPGSYNTLQSAVAANAETILGQMRIEFREMADILIDALEASGYPEDRVLYAEPGNENWNYGSISFKRSFVYALGLGEGLFPDIKNSGPMGYGVIVAAWAEALNERLAARGRANQQWLVPLNTKTAGTSGSTLSKYYDGAEAYNARFNSPVPLSKMPAAGTGYWSGAARFRTPNFLNVTEKKSYPAAFCAAIKADSDAAGKAMRDWFLDPKPIRDNVAALMNYQASIDRIARERGTFFLGHYEGGNHDNVNKAHLKACPAMTSFLNNWQHGPDAGAVQAAFNEQFVSTYPDAVLANYIYRADRFAPDKPWFDLKPTETTNPYYQAWEKYLRPPVSER